MNLSHFTTHVPSPLPLSEVLPLCGLTSVQERTFRRFYKLETVSWAPQTTLQEGLGSAVARLLDETGVARSRVKYLLYAHTFPTVSPFARESLRKVARATGLSDATAFSISNGQCASGILGLDVCRRLLGADEAAILVAGEKCYHPWTRVLPSGLMSEGATAVLLERAGSRNELVGFAKTSQGEYAVLPHKLDRDQVRRFNENYLATLAATLRRALAESGSRVSDLGFIFPHNLNIESFNALAKLLEVPPETFFTSNISKVGHSFCADVFLNYACAEREGLLPKNKPNAFLSGGLGATFAAAILR